MQIQDNVFIITGGASGLGAATARMLTAAGGKVVLADVQTEAGQALAAELNGVFVQCDVTSEEDGMAVVAAAGKLGTLRGLVNCAGQKPIRCINAGNARNIGNVGITYQKVYQAWLAIFASATPSRRSHTSTRIVTSGSAATRPPSRSLRLASSETSTTRPAVTKYFRIVNAIVGSGVQGSRYKVASL